MGARKHLTVLLAYISYYASIVGRLESHEELPVILNPVGQPFHAFSGWDGGFPVEFRFQLPHIGDVGFLVCGPPAGEADFRTLTCEFL